jgi:hypothetical protein
MQALGPIRRFMAAGLLCGTAALACAQESRGILDDKDAKNAVMDVLRTETQLLETIRQGIALSIAQCELTPECAPTVSREELRRIIGKIETRLDVLSARHASVGNEELEPVMLAYAESRDGYNEFLSRLDTILPPEGEEGEVRDLGTLPEEFAIFSDADAVLLDDTDELPAESEPAAAPTE